MELKPQTIIYFGSNSEESAPSLWQLKFSDTYICICDHIFIL